MIDHPDMHEPAVPQEKLVLPAVPPEQLQSPPVYSNPRMQVPPEMLIRHNSPPPRSPLAKLLYFWHKDPAYKVLLIAVAMVVIAGLLLTTFVTSALLHGLGGLASGGPVVQNPAATAQPVGTVDNKPAFPTPGGGSGSTVTSQPPVQSTPILQPTTPPTPPTPPTGSLTVQITHIPNHVRNNTSVDVGVSTNQANISVSLVIYYNSFPYRGMAGPVTTDNNGNATIRWFVFVNAFSNRVVTASVYAVARDQNGQVVRSQPVTVQISVQAGGGGM